MRIPNWSAKEKPQPPELVDAILARRGGALLNLDKALLWSEPLARSWNGYLKAVRTELSASRELRELAICTVALLTGAHYEYHHHAPDFLVAGGTQAQLNALQSYAAGDLTQAPQDPAFSEVDAAVIHYASQMTRQVRVEETVFASLQSHFDTTQIVEMTAAIATYNMVARFLVALQVSPES
jgi:alkylhydroperoxidase family enzyme